MTLVAALVVHALAGAASGAVREGVSWRAQPACPSPAELAARIEREIGPAPSLGTTVTADAVVTGQPGAYRMRVTLRERDSTTSRSISADDCTTLVDAYVLLLRVSVQRSGPAEPTREHEPAPERFAEIGIGPVLEAGPFPGLAGGAALWGAGSGPRWTAGLELGFARAGPSSLGPDARLRLQRYAVSGFAGPALRRPWGAVSLTAGAELGGLLAMTSGPVDVTQPHALWFAVHTAVALSVTISPRVSLTAAARGSLSPRRIHFDRAGYPSRATGRWGARALVGVALRLPPGPRRGR